MTLFNILHAHLMRAAALNKYFNQEENMEKETAMECLDRIIDRLSDDQFGFLIGAIGYLKDYINSKE